MLHVLAFSLQGEVDKYGGYLGIASFVGLAALALLYFAQAKELKRLRDWAGRAPERALELQERVVAEAETAARRVRAEPTPVPGVPVPVPVAAGVATPAAGEAGADPPPTAVPAVAAGEVPAAAGGDSEPAAAEPAAAEAEPAEAASADGAAAGAEAETAAAGNGTAADAPAAADGPPAHEKVEALAPAAAVATGGGAVAAPAAAASATGSAPTGALPPLSAAARGAEDAPPPRAGEPPRDLTPLPRRAPARAGAGSAPLRASTASATPATRGPSRNALLYAGGGILAVAVVALVLTQVLGGSSPKPAPNRAQPAAATHSRTSTTGTGTSTAHTGSPTSPANVKVAVLNGTTVSGLAASVADKLAKAGYPKPEAGNNTDQQRAASQVFYAKPADKPAAQTVARLLKISDVLQLDPNTGGLVSAGIQVVVVTGADQAQ